MAIGQGAIRVLGVAAALQSASALALSPAAHAPGFRPLGAPVSRSAAPQLILSGAQTPDPPTGEESSAVTGRRFNVEVLERLLQREPTHDSPDGIAERVVAAIVPAADTEALAPSAGRRYAKKVLAVAALLAAGRAAMPSFLTAYGAAAVSAPVACAVGTAGVKGLCTDLLAQLGVERKSGAPFDFMRTISFISFNALYMGWVAHYKYNVFYAAVFGASSSAATIATKIAFDMFLFAPFIYFPLFFLMKGVFAGKSPRAALGEFVSRSGAKLLAYFWAVWAPVETFMWCFVPAHLRIAFLCSFSLFWQVLLSTLSYRKSDATGVSKGESSNRARAPFMAAQKRT